MGFLAADDPDNSKPVEVPVFAGFCRFSEMGWIGSMGSMTKEWGFVPF
jgi:hypothetical protein